MAQKAKGVESPFILGYASAKSAAMTFFVRSIAVAIRITGPVFRAV
jgi:hypothetical protein